MRVSGWLYLLEQTISSACLLMASGLCTGMRLHSPWRLLLLSPILAVVTMAAQPLSLPLRLLVLLPAAALSPMLVWPAAPLRIRLRMALYSPALSLMLSGLLRLLAPLPLPGFLLLLIGCTALSLASLRASGSSPPPRCTAVDLRVGTQRASLSALVDSGNLLRVCVVYRCEYPGNLEFAYGGDGLRSTGLMVNYRGGNLSLNGTVKKVMDSGILTEVVLPEGTYGDYSYGLSSGIKTTRMLPNQGKMVVWNTDKQQMQVISMADVVKGDFIYSWWQTNVQNLFIVYR